MYLPTFFCGRHLLREAAEAVEDADDLVGRPQRRLERNLPDAAGGEGLIGDDRRLRRQHQREIGIEDRLAVERAEIAARIAAQAERVLAADVERHFAFQLALGGVEEADHAAEMIVMTVAQHQRVEGRRIDLEDRQIVEQNFRRVAEVDQHVALLSPGEGLRVHGETPFAVENGARRLVRRRVAALALDGDAVAGFGRDELDDDIVGDHAHRELVHHRHVAAQCLRRRGLGAGGERRDHRRDEASAASAKLADAGQKGGTGIGAGTKQHL